jgi:hypothetical protein
MGARARREAAVFRELREGTTHERERAGVSASGKMAKWTRGGLSGGWARGWWPEFARTWAWPWRARGPGVRGGERADKRGPADSDIDARAHNGPGHQQGDPLGREGEGQRTN